MRKMAINGLIIYTDMTDIKETNRELHSIGVNVNQIARRVNETNSIYKEDIAELKNYMDEIWKQQKNFAVITESAKGSTYINLFMRYIQADKNIFVCYSGWAWGNSFDIIVI